MAGRRSASATTPVAVWILASVATLWFLRAAAALLIPIAVAVLITYALEPPVAWLERRRLHRLAAASLVLVVVLGGVATTAYALRHDAMRLVKSLPMVTAEARAIVSSQLGVDTGAIDRAASALGGGEDPAETVGTSGESTAPLVERVVGAVLGTAGDVVVVIFLVFFLLISGHQLRNRVVEIAGREAEQRRLARTIIDDINRQIQRYLIVLLLTASVVGTATWLALAWIGAEQAALWGVLAGIFNSIPYFGPVIVSGGLFLVGIGQGGGISQAVQMSGAALVITTLEGWLLTPPLMGRAEKMSALAVFLGLLLWTWVWGAWGTVLAVPMLVVIKSVADHVERLRPVGRLMAP
jgi:predicted PurR-regulated permease PerM